MIDYHDAGLMPYMVWLVLVGITAVVVFPIALVAVWGRR